MSATVARQTRFRVGTSIIIIQYSNIIVAASDRRLGVLVLYPRPNPGPGYIMLLTKTCMA